MGSGEGSEVGTPDPGISSVEAFSRDAVSEAPSELPAGPALRSYFPRFDGRARLHKRLHPGEHALPAFAVILGRFLVARESSMAEFDGGPHTCFLGTPGLKVVDCAWLEFPSHPGVRKLAEGAPPGMDEQARWIDLEVFAVDAKGGSVRSYAHA